MFLHASDRVGKLKATGLTKALPSISRTDHCLCAWDLTILVTPTIPAVCSPSCMPASIEMRTIVIDGKQYDWKEIRRLRREQLQAA